LYQKRIYLLIAVLGFLSTPLQARRIDDRHQTVASSKKKTQSSDKIYCFWFEGAQLSSLVTSDKDSNPSHASVQDCGLLSYYLLFGKGWTYKSVFPLW
jgi:hypothetical protein